MSHRLRFALILIVFVLPLEPATSFAHIGGYVWPPSVAQGDTASFFISTDAASFEIDVFRVGVTDVLFGTLGPYAGLEQPVPDSAWAVGCGWTPLVRLPIPASWPSGVYTVRLRPAGTSGEGWLIFTVREDDPGTTGRILFQNAIFTWQAYNIWGGKSLYDNRSSGGKRSYAVSLKRPYETAYPLGEFATNEAKCVRWLESQGYAVEYCTDLDMQNDPDLEQHYELLIIAGHSEYWSRPMREHVMNRVERGRHVAFLGGNTCWWQVRFSPFDQIVCFKDRCLDPLYGISNSIVTVRWHEPPVFDPESAMTGVSFQDGGYVNALGWFPASEGYGGYTACNTDHWLYGGTGATDGRSFGTDQQIVGPEVDGALHTWLSGHPMVTGAHATPKGFQILAYSPASEGAGTMGFYTHDSGAMVFNAATINWCQGLGRDSVVTRVTRNYLQAAVGDPLAIPGVTGAEARVELRVLPNPSRSSVGFSIAGSVDEPLLLGIYGVDGRLVSRVPIESLAEGRVALWSGKDDGGKDVAPGVYMAILEGEKTHLTRKVILAR